MYKRFFFLLGGVLACLGFASATSFAEEVTEVAAPENLESSIAQGKKSLETWARGDEEIMQQFQRFTSTLQKAIKKGLLEEGQARQVLDALSFAAEKHKDQLRKNERKTPYIIHPMGVAQYVMVIGKVYDHEVLIAALLHDTLEDTGATPKEIRDRYGDAVASYVLEVTDNKALSPKERKRQQIIHAFRQSKGAAIIKLADKLHNLGTLMTSPPEGWNQERIDQYFQWAQVVIDNLPEANDSLKAAVHKTIAKYWESQE